MQKRINIYETEPQSYEGMLTFEKYLSNSSLKPLHKELIKIRASQMNGCAYCLDMHTRDARKLGESEQRIYLLSAWRESNLFSDEEKAILALTEEVTHIQKGVSDSVYQNAANYFDEHYLAQIIMAIVAINAWNRIAIATHLEFK